MPSTSIETVPATGIGLGRRRPGEDVPGIQQGAECSELRGRCAPVEAGRRVVELSPASATTGPSPSAKSRSFGGSTLGARQSASTVKPPIAPSAPITAAGRGSTDRGGAGPTTSAPGPTIAAGLANANDVWFVEHADRRGVKYRREQHDLAQRILRVLTDGAGYR